MAKRYNYTQFTLKKLRADGMTVDVAEKWVPFFGSKSGKGMPGGHRRDLLGFIDIIAISPEHGIVGVQSTGPTGKSAHRKAILAEPNAVKWLEAGGKIQLWAWKKLLVKNKDGKFGKARRWTPRIENITIDQFYLLSQ